MHAEAETGIGTGIEIEIELMCAGQVSPLIRLFVELGLLLSEEDAGRMKVKGEDGFKNEDEKEKAHAGKQTRQTPRLRLGYAVVNCNFMGIVSCRFGSVRLCVRICIIVLYESFEA